MNKQNLQKAMDTCLSGLTATRESREAVFRRLSGGILMKKKVSLGIVVVIVLFIALAGVAFAITNGFGVLNFGSVQDKGYYFTLPEAETLVHKDLASVKYADLTFCVEEAYYDGRVLQFLISVTSDSNIAKHNGWEGYCELLNKAGVYYGVDGNDMLWVNGECFEVRSLGIRDGEKANQFYLLVDSELVTGWPNERKERLAGDIDIMIPLVKKNSEKISELSFIMDVGDVAEKWQLKLPVINTGDVCQVQFTDLHFSPINVSIDYTVLVPATITQEVWYINKEEKYYSFIESYIGSDSLFNDKDEPLGRTKAGSLYKITPQNNGDELLNYHMEYAPSDMYTNVNHLFINGVRLDIPMVYQK